MTETRHDYVNKTTSGRFRIIYVYTQEMNLVHSLIDRRSETSFFR